MYESGMLYFKNAVVTNTDGIPLWLIVFSAFGSNGSLFSS